MRSCLIFGALAIGLGLSSASTAAPIAPAGLRGDTPTAADTVLVRRCPPGYRRTLGGCMRKRPSWWSMLLGR